MWLLIHAGINGPLIPLTDSSVEFDLNEAIIPGAVHLQYLNVYEVCPYMVKGEFIPVLTIVVRAILRGTPD